MLTKITNRFSAREAICKRAKAGLVRSRARLFKINTRAESDSEIPAHFWWAEGKAALTADWITGDFETWLDSKILLQAFGVTFMRADIEAMLPADALAASAPTAAAAKAGGRPSADWWDDLWVEICRQVWEGELQPKKQADIENAMLVWLTAQNLSASNSTVRPRARKLWAVMKDKN